jgi:hypothetical protein
MPQSIVSLRQEKKIFALLRQKRSSRRKFKKLTYAAIAAKVSTRRRILSKNTICGLVRRRGKAKPGKNSHWRGR